MNRHCANCGCDLKYATSDGISSLYNPSPSGKDIRLCEPCFFEEDNLIEEEGTNVIPERLARYKDTIRKLG